MRNGPDRHTPGSPFVPDPDRQARLERITITIGADLLARIDAFREASGLPNRSRAICDLLRAGLPEAEDDESPAVGVVVVTRSRWFGKRWRLWTHRKRGTGTARRDRTRSAPRSSPRSSGESAGRPASTPGDSCRPHPLP